MQTETISAMGGKTSDRELWAAAAREEFCWYQRWRLGDMVIWDNRCTMHRRDALDPQERRLLNRAQIKGARPIAVAA